MNHYQIGAYLGQGANATVREATHCKTGHDVAIKIYDKDKLEKNQNIKRSVLSEIQILNYLSKSINDFDNTLETSMEGDHSQPGKRGHPCIMKLYDAFETSK